MIKEVKATWIIDSRAMPTIKAIVKTEKATGIGHAPAGASKGKNEAYELRDNEKAFHGFGVENAIKNINRVISKALVGKDEKNQKDIDKTMIKLDGTKNKKKLGANAIIACSIACIDAAAKSDNVELFHYISSIAKTEYKMPLCMFNVINGGKHAGNMLAFQEFLLVPQLKNIRDNIKAACEIYISLKSLLQKLYGKHSTNVGDEGGFSPNFEKNWQALDLITKAIKEMTYENDVKISIDAAASSFYNNRNYYVDGKTLKPDELVDYYKDLIKTYKILSIEDPFSEEHYKYYKELKSYTKVIGDDLTVTNIEFVRNYKGLINGLIIKPNQIGTITETIETFKFAKKHCPFIITSHRSGETESSFIADLAVGLGSPYVKFGAPARGERTAKYNRLMEIGDML
jgi:enolase